MISPSSLEPKVGTKVLLAHEESGLNLVRYSLT